MYLDSMRTSDGIQINGATVTPEVPVDSEKPSWFPEEGEGDVVWRSGTENAKLRWPERNPVGNYLVAYLTEKDAWESRKHLAFGDVVRDPYPDSLTKGLEVARSQGKAFVVCDGDLGIIEVYR